MIPALLAIALTTQIRPCQTAQTFQQQLYPVAAPVVQYAQPTYATNYNAQAAYVEKILYVPIEQADPESYYGGVIASAARAEQKQVEKAQVKAASDAKIDALTRLVQDLQRKLDTPPPPPVQPPPRPINEVPPFPTKRGSTAASTPSPPLPATSYPVAEAVPPPPLVPSQASSEVREKAVAILKTACIRCHASPASAGGEFAIFNRDGSIVNLEPADLLSIDTAVYSGTMPKGRSPLSSEDYSVIRSWIDESRPAITSSLKSHRQKGKS